MNPTICHVLLELPERKSTQPAVLFHHQRQWHKLSWRQFYDDIYIVACGLQKLGIARGDKVAIMADTQYKWSICDWAALAIGAVTVPIYPSSSSEDVEFVLNHSECKLAFVDSPKRFDEFQMTAARCPLVQQIITMFDTPSVHHHSVVMSWKQLCEIGQTLAATHSIDFLQSCQAAQPSDLATIVYTSGTTGLPRGVILTHAQIMSEMQDVFSAVGITSEDTTLSFLPYSHVFGRIEHWGHVYIGYSMGYARSIEAIREDIKTIRPTFIVAVPRIFEKIYGSALSQGKSSFLKRKIFDWALSVGKTFSQYRQKRALIPIHLIPKYQLAKKLVFNKIIESLGGRLRTAFSGGAPLAPAISQFFHSAGLLIIEGYGLTETTAAVFANSPIDYQFGSVGKPLKDVKVRLAEDGEILIQSDKVMKGYYKDDQATELCLKDGWFATGDIGVLSDDQRLTITDRKKDLIKTANGKYVAPQKLENLLKLHPLISQVLIHGDKRKFIVALVTLNSKEAIHWAQSQKLSLSAENLAGSGPIQDQVSQIISDTNARLASHEAVKKFHILDHDFTVEEGQLTPSLKVKRKFCDQKYREILEELYC